MRKFISSRKAYVNDQFTSHSVAIFKTDLSQFGKKNLRIKSQNYTN